jgi:hypothetical protein
MMDFVYEIALSFSYSSLTCREILHVADGFTSLPKESVLRIFIALQNPLSGPGLNQRTLDPATSTLTITPLR